MEEAISQMFLDLTHVQHIGIFLLNHIQCHLQLGHVYWHLFHPPLLQFVKILHQYIE